MMGMLLSGYRISMIIFAVTLVGSIPLGMLVALGRLSKFKPLSLLMQLFISVLRGTPLMLQMFAVSFMPYYVFGLKTGADFPMIAVLISFVINYAAYFAEIYRSGIQSIPRGQYEAAEVLGYSSRQTFQRIMLPQVVKRVLPAMGNEVVTLVKDTSLAFSLGVLEMFTQARAIARAHAHLVGRQGHAAQLWPDHLHLERLHH